jgi:spermidine/putrescine transport system permease protein
MIRSLPNTPFYKYSYRLYITLFFIFLVLPLLAISVLAFNDSNFIALPWKGFTLDWFFANSSERVGLFNDTDLLRSIWVSIETALAMGILSTVVGTIAALLFEQEKFRFKGLLYFFAIAPLVIPGVILGISILLSSTYVGTLLDTKLGIDAEFFSPGFWLVVLGQFSFGATYALLLVSARLKKFDPELEEAALSLKATRLESIRYITLPFLKPAIIGAFAVTFIMSFSNFNTTIFLIGSDPTLPVELFSRIKFSSTPVLNAVSFMIVLIITVVATISVLKNRKK